MGIKYIHRLIKNEITKANVVINNLDFPNKPASTKSN